MRRAAAAAPINSMVAGRLHHLRRQRPGVAAVLQCDGGRAVGDLTGRSFCPTCPSDGVAGFRRAIIDEGCVIPDGTVIGEDAAADRAAFPCHRAGRRAGDPGHAAQDAAAGKVALPAPQRRRWCGGSGRQSHQLKQVRGDDRLHCLTGQRRAGVLLHPTSLPGPWEAGVLGADARRFVDWLCEGGFPLWQMLPVGPVGDTLSPYQISSAFAGNPRLIDPEALRSGWLAGRADARSGGASWTYPGSPAAEAWPRFRAARRRRRSAPSSLHYWQGSGPGCCRTRCSGLPAAATATAGLVDLAGSPCALRQAGSHRAICWRGNGRRGPGNRLRAMGVRPPVAGLRRRAREYGVELVGRSAHLRRSGQRGRLVAPAHVPGGRHRAGLRPWPACHPTTSARGPALGQPAL